MTENAPVSVTARLAAMHAERVPTWPTDVYRAKEAERRALERDADRAGFVAAGDEVPDFTAVLPGGGQVTLEDLLADGPAVLLFFRFATCPACNTALRAYEETLAPTLREWGVPLLALTPQLAERAGEIRDAQRLSFPVAEDVDAALARHFGITFTMGEESIALNRAFANVDLGELIGTGRWELPMPTALVIGQDRRVRFADVHPDWLVRTESHTLLAEVRVVLDERVAVDA